MTADRENNTEQIKNKSFLIFKQILRENLKHEKHFLCFFLSFPGDMATIFRPIQTGE